MKIFEDQQSLAIDRTALAELVRRFYGDVRHDPTLGPVFQGAIGAEQWDEHQERMVAFWCTAVLGTREFRGKVMDRHRALPGLTPAHFSRWLALFEANAAALFAPPDVQRLMDLAHGSARGMQIGLFGRAA